METPAEDLPIVWSNERPAVSAYEPRFHVVLHEPEIAANAGNIGRTCVACRAKLWLVRPMGFQLDERRLRRAGLDYWPHLVWQVADDWNALVRDLAGARFWFFSKSAATLYTDVEYRPGDALVFGSESRGLPPSMRGEKDRCLRLPIDPPVRSLNLAAAVAVALYEARRQCDRP